MDAILLLDVLVGFLATGCAALIVYGGWLCLPGEPALPAKSKSEARDPMESSV
jgi:hypothetical protein